MMDPGKIEVAGAGGAMLLTALFVLRAGAVRAPESKREPEPTTTDQPPAAPASEVESPVPGGTPGRRPRILTGEPASPEPRRSGTKRAFKLLAGITTLAVGIAVGLIALVRALIELFSRI